MKKGQKHIDSIVSRILNETLEEKASEMVKKIKSKVEEDMEEGEWTEIDMSEEPEVCSECGGMMREGECSECGYGSMNESEQQVCSECGGMMYEGECSECGMHPQEESYGETGKFGKFDYVETDEDFDMGKVKKGMKKIGRGLKHFAATAAGIPTYDHTDSETGEWKTYKDKEGNKKDYDMFSYDTNQGDVDEEMEEGNAFTGALARAKKDGDDTFTVDGKKYNVKESKNSLQLTEDELIDVIEKLVKEEIEKESKVKDNIRKTAKPSGLANYERAVKGSKKENEDYIKSVTKKMKDYLKDASKGEYDMNPKIFPKGNGELSKMDKKAYVPTRPVEDYVDNFTAAGLENIDYDEIHPDEKWVEDNVVGSSRTGNNPEWANTGESDVNKKRNKIRKDNMLAKLKRKAYNKAPQPVVNDKSDETAGSKIMKQLESTEEKKNKLIKEEFNKMTHLIQYNRKTQ